LQWAEKGVAVDRDRSCSGRRQELQRAVVGVAVGGERSGRAETGVAAGRYRSCSGWRQELQRAETGVAAGGDSRCREETDMCRERRQEVRRDETCDRRCKEETGRAKK